MVSMYFIDPQYAPYATSFGLQASQTMWTQYLTIMYE
jgi:hypothetical protein